MGREDEVTQAERRRIMAEERISTYRAHAEANTDLELGGRFAKLTRTTVVGTGPSINYPKLPEGSPWAKDECPPEPPIDGTGDGNRLGYRIDGGQEPVAEPKPKSGFRRF